MNDFKKNWAKMDDFYDIFNDFDIGQAFISENLTIPCLFCVNHNGDCFSLSQGGNKIWFIDKTSLIELICSDETTAIASAPTFEEALDRFVQTVTYGEYSTYDELERKFLKKHMINSPKRAHTRRKKNEVLK